MSHFPGDSMQDLIQQLASVRQRARTMLILIRAAHWLAAVVAVAILAGVLDFALRLPAWPRAILLALGFAAAAYFAVVRIGAALRLRPALTSLALRLERVDPSARGHFASAVAFATDEPHVLTTPIARRLADLTAAEAHNSVSSDQIASLLNPVHLYRSVALLALTLIALTLIALAAPQALATSVSRWVSPFGPARWPNLYHIESLTTLRNAPNNAPLRLAAQVTKGDRPGVRTWLNYRFLDANNAPVAGSDWQAPVLMTRQSDPKFPGLHHRLVEPSTAAASIEFYFEAGDDQTATQRINLVQPPTLRRLVARIYPPEYAAGIVVDTRVDLLTPPRPTVTLDALEGSTIQLEIIVDGSFATPDITADPAIQQRWIAAALPGILENLSPESIIASDPHISGILLRPRNEFVISWILHNTHQFHFNLTDTFGAAYEDQRVFRIEMRPDHAPRAAVLEPAADESVLATATLTTRAEAFDDVALKSLDLVARPPDKASPITLATETKPEPHIFAASPLDLAPLKLKPGQELALVAIATDSYSLDGKTHPAVESAPRRIRIISTDELTRQVRTDLAELRQRAERAKAEQEALTESPADRRTAQQQQEMTERLTAMKRTVGQLQQRLKQNKLDDEALDQTLKQSQQLTESAEKSSELASQSLDQSARDAEKKSPEAAQHQQQAKESQKSAQKNLQDLADLLDQGRDAFELKQKLLKLSKDQEDLAAKTKQTTPRTLGKTAEELSDKDKKDLAEQAAEQKSLAEQAQQLTERMRTTAAALARQSEKLNDQATAEAMRQAAAKSTQDGLQEKMKQAAEKVEQNKLSGAQQEQAAAQQTIQDMLQQLGKTDQFRQQILQRKLMELADAIRKLRDQQQAQLERLLAALKLDDLDGPLLTLRRNTLAVAQDARESDAKTAPVAAKLTDAAAAQAEAVVALRNQPAAIRPDAEKGERDALARLDEALKLADDLAKKSQDDLSDKAKEELVKGYQKALAEQKEIQAATQALVATPDEQRDRKWRSDSLTLGNREADLRVDLTKLRQKLQDTIVYKSVHDQMDAWAGEASASLRRAQAKTTTQLQEQMVAMSIEAMIEALKPEDPKQEFAENQPPDSDSSSNDAANGKKKLIPPLAELKLLRTRQDQLHTMTRGAEQAATDTPSADARALVEDLARQQKDLADSGDALLEQLQQQQQRGTPPGDPQ